MTVLFLFVLLSVIPTACPWGDFRCEKNAPEFPDLDGKLTETGQIKEWFAEAKKEWDDLFDGDHDFILWDELDLGRDPKLMDEIQGLDASKLECKNEPRKGFPFGMRWELGYDLEHATPSMYDWDEKMAKKAIVAGIQPPDEKKDWYLPLVYQAFYPYDTEAKIAEIVQAVTDWFKANPGDNNILFLKGTLGGGTGTSIAWCDSSAKGTARPMYKIKRHDKMEESIRLCVQEVVHFVNDYKARSLAGVKEADAPFNPAGTYGYPGFLVEPGYKFDVEVKTHVIWGKLFGIGTQTPHACMHVSNGHNGKFIRFRGYEGDNRPTTEEDKTMWEANELFNCSKITDEMFGQVKRIAETVGKHTDFVRVDIFIDTETGAMVVNEIEGYYRVCGFDVVIHAESVKLMAQTWVEGWQKLEKRGKLKRVTRPHGRYQDVAPPWIGGGGGSAGSGITFSSSGGSGGTGITGHSSGGGISPILVPLWILSLVLVGGFMHFRSARASKRSVSAIGLGVELGSSHIETR